MTSASPLARTTELFTAEDIFRRISERVSPTLSPTALDRTALPPFGDYTLNTNWELPPGFLDTARVAAVLVGLIEREDGVSVILTRRTGDLRDHAGQIALPGGKIDPEDRTPADAAIREAHEEIGLKRGNIDILGYLDAYLSGSGYRIIPVIARIRPPFDLVLNPAEVDEVFEVPFEHLMQATNYQTRTRIWRERERAFYTIEHGERTIWGITAGILRALYERLYL